MIRIDRFHPRILPATVAPSPGVTRDTGSLARSNPGSRVSFPANARCSNLVNSETLGHAARVGNFVHAIAPAIGQLGSTDPPFPFPRESFLAVHQGEPNYPNYPGYRVKDQSNLYTIESSRCARVRFRGGSPRYNSRVTGHQIRERKREKKRESWSTRRASGDIGPISLVVCWKGVAEETEGG